MRIRRGQALIELAIGMLTLVMVVTVLCGFCAFMTRSLKAQNSTRSGTPVGNGSVDVGIRIGDSEIRTMKVREHCQMPPLTIFR